LRRIRALPSSNWPENNEPEKQKKLSRSPGVKHEAQALNYLTATGFRLAILLNPSPGLRACFGADSLQHQRVVK